MNIIRQIPCFRSEEKYVFTSFVECMKLGLFYSMIKDNKNEDNKIRWSLKDASMEEHT